MDLWAGVLPDARVRREDERFFFLWDEERRSIPGGKHRTSDGKVESRRSSEKGQVGYPDFWAGQCLLPLKNGGGSEKRAGE